MKKKAEPLMLNEKAEGVIRKVLYQSPISDDFEKFLQLYKEDKKKARITYFHHNDDYYGGNGIREFNSHGFSFHNLVLFEKSNGDFSIVLSKVKWGLSITTKMYKSESTESMISFKKADKKFWLITKGRKEKKMLLPLTLSNFHPAFPYAEIKPIVLEELQNRFGWLRYVQENNVAHSIAFNTIMRNKLFSLESLMRHIYKAPYPVAKKLHTAITQVSSLRTFGNRKKLLSLMRYVNNIESLTEERAKSGLFWDTVRMGMVLDRRVNCSWGDARLKREHDEWSMEITTVLMDSKSRDMSISSIYHEFATFSGYQLLTTTKEMVREGMVNRHCVASYISKVDNGKCAIFHIEGHTLEVVNELHKDGFYGLTMIQLKGHLNKEAPDEMKKRVNDSIAKFNEEKKRENASKRSTEATQELNDMINAVNRGAYVFTNEHDLPF